MEFHVPTRLCLGSKLKRARGRQQGIIGRLPKRNESLRRPHMDMGAFVVADLQVIGTLDWILHRWGFYAEVSVIH